MIAWVALAIIVHSSGMIDIQHYAEPLKSLEDCQKIQKLATEILAKETGIIAVGFTCTKVIVTQVENPKKVVVPGPLVVETKK